MKLSHFFMEIRSFETMHCLKFNSNVRNIMTLLMTSKVTSWFESLSGAWKTCYFLPTYFYIILSMCTMELAEKFTLILFAFKWFYIKKVLNVIKASFHRSQLILYYIYCTYRSRCPAYFCKCWVFSNPIWASLKIAYIFGHFWKWKFTYVYKGVIVFWFINALSKLYII